MSVCATVVVPSRFRQIEEPPRHGEKPFVQLAEEAFDGPNLRLSKRLRLLEEASNRKIRRGDALAVIASIQRKREKAMKITPPGAMRTFATRYAFFAAGFAALAAAWCVVLG